VDKKFLRQVGVANDDPDFRLALAEEIAKHDAPIRVAVEPDAANRQLIKMALLNLLNASQEPQHQHPEESRRQTRSNKTPQTPR
jgi:hypothetical protein